MHIDSIEQVHHFLDVIPAFKNEGKQAADFSLERFAKFCEAIEDPQKLFPSIHVGGSNGKGSTCQIIASIYLQAGYKVGLYTSPHLISYSERFTINGVEITDSELILFFDTYHARIKSFRLTYFEISTALAFWWFARQKVDIGIIEVGLGGRLDSTNIINPLASVITSVTLDHMDILGDTIEAIAREKAGIIKPETPVIIGNLPEAANTEVRRAATQAGSAIYDSTELEPVWGKEGYTITAEGKSINLLSGLRTPVQAYNIAMAWKTTQVLENKLPVSNGSRKKGIRNARTYYPARARFEQLYPQERWYFDGAHNLEAVQAMKQMVQTMKPIGETVLVLSLMKDKINEKVMIEFSEFKKIVYYALPLGRAASINDVRLWLPDVKPFPETQQSRHRLLKQLSGKLVIFAGSFYFYPAVRDWLSSFKNNR